MSPFLPGGGPCPPQPLLRVPSPGWGSPSAFEDPPPCPQPFLGVPIPPPPSLSPTPSARPCPFLGVPIPFWGVPVLSLSPTPSGGPPFLPLTRPPQLRVPGPGQPLQPARAGVGRAGLLHRLRRRPPPRPPPPPAPLPAPQRLRALVKPGLGGVIWGVGGPPSPVIPPSHRPVSPPPQPGRAPRPSPRRHGAGGRCGQGRQGNGVGGCLRAPPQPPNPVPSPRFLLSPPIF